MTDRLDRIMAEDRKAWERIKELEAERNRYWAALVYYRQPHTYGSGELSIFLDVGGVARKALDA